VSFNQVKRCNQQEITSEILGHQNIVLKNGNFVMKWNTHLYIHRFLKCHNICGVIFKKVDISSPSESEVKHLDWKLCILCQRVTNDRLVDPVDIHGKENMFQGYKSLESFLTRLNDLGQLSSLPYKVSMSALNDGLGICNTFILNKAKYHKKCKDECCERKLLRVTKRLEKIENVSEILARKIREVSSSVYSLQNVQSTESLFKTH